MITLVDYGLGNLRAFQNIYKGLNIPVSVARTAVELEGAKKLILPGVGAFDWAMTRLNESGMRDALQSLVCVEGVPVLGVCVGMQMLANSSEEGEMEGLGWIEAEVRRLQGPESSQRLSLPHMGWNSAAVQRYNPLLAGLSQEAEFYFLHSYYFAPVRDRDSVATSHYGQDFVSVVNSENVFGTQFHPEKSHAWGVRLLKNFAELAD